MGCMAALDAEKYLSGSIMKVEKGIQISVVMEANQISSHARGVRFIGKAWRFF